MYGWDSPWKCYYLISVGQWWFALRDNLVLFDNVALLSVMTEFNYQIHLRSSVLKASSNLLF